MNNEAQFNNYQIEHFFDEMFDGSCLPRAHYEKIFQRFDRLTELKSQKVGSRQTHLFWNMVLLLLFMGMMVGQREFSPLTSYQELFREVNGM